MCWVCSRRDLCNIIFTFHLVCCAFQRYGGYQYQAAISRKMVASASGIVWAEVSLLLKRG
jgi:hypothetical protein